MNTSIEEINVLARSPSRIRLLEELYEHERLKKDALKKRVDASRTTIQRNLDALKEQGWVDENNREYWITHSGRPVAEQFLELLNTVHAAKRLQPFLEWLPEEDIGLPFSALATADITVADRSNPYAPINRHIDLMKSAEWFRCLLPAVGLQPMMVAHDCVVEEGSRHEIIIDPDIVATLRNDDTYKELLMDLQSTSRSTFLIADRTIPFYLGLANDKVQLGVGDDNGVPRSLIETEAREVQKWAEETYEGYRALADPLPPHHASQTSTARDVK